MLAKTATQTLRKCLPWLQDWAAGALDLVFPPICLICETVLEESGRTSDSVSSTPFCPRCVANLAPIKHGCLRCGSPVPEVVSEPVDCIRCRRFHWSFDRVIALGAYGGTIQEAVIAAKQYRHQSLSLALGNLLAKQIATRLNERFDMVVPLPSHWMRRLRRKNSSAELLAESISRQFGIKLNSHLLRCNRKTEKQGMLNVTRRQANMKNAFTARRTSHWQGKHILLVDDVLTSGSTASEAAKAIKQAGAKVVTVAVVARGLGKN